MFQTSAVAGKAGHAPSWQSRSVGLQLGSAVALTEPMLRAVVPTVASVPEPLGALEVPRREPSATVGVIRRQAAVASSDSGGSKPVLAYPVNASLTLGLGYRYVKGEDLVFKTVDPGTLSPDYDSHNVLLRARWRF